MISAIFTRSALVFHGFNPGPDVAGMETDVHGVRHIIRWSDVMAKRRERQRELLARKRNCAQSRAHRLTVAYYDQDLMGGWQAMIEDWRGRDFDIWIDRDRRWLRPLLMTVYPLVLRFGNEEKEWEMWKPAFASQFRRRQQDGEPVGVDYLWWDGSGKPRPVEKA